MPIIRCIDCAFDNTRMTDANCEIIAAENSRWDDGHTETEVLWARDKQPIADAEVPF